MNKYLKRCPDGQVDWSREGMEFLNRATPDLIRSTLGYLLLERNFGVVDGGKEYVLLGVVRVLLDEESVRVVRGNIIYNSAMCYVHGGDELCDLWDMIRMAWSA